MGLIGHVLCAQRSGWWGIVVEQVTRQMKGLPLRPRPITSPRKAFFCMVKVSVTKVALARSLSVAVGARTRQFLT
jgi:hypothetical protein